MTTLIRITDHEDERLHIENAPGLGGGAAITLCGWVDVSHEYDTSGDPPDCGECLKIVAFCKGLRGIPKP